MNSKQAMHEYLFLKYLKNIFVGKHDFVAFCCTFPLSFSFHPCWVMLNKSTAELTACFLMIAKKEIISYSFDSKDFLKDNLQSYLCFDVLFPSLTLSPAAALPSLPQCFFSCMLISLWWCIHLHFDASAKERNFMLSYCCNTFVSLSSYFSVFQYFIPLFHL